MLLGLVLLFVMPLGLVLFDTVLLLPFIMLVVLLSL